MEKGITTGATATTFDPNGQCMRAAVVTFLWRYLDKPEATATNSFTDVEAGMWYEAPINWAVGAGVTNGLSATEFGIDATATVPRLSPSCTVLWSSKIPNQPKAL